MARHDRLCVICEKPFRTYHERVLSCSIECGKALRAQRRASRADRPQPNPARGSHITDQYRRTTTMPCPVCSTPFEQRPDGRPETCSWDCGVRLRGRRHSELWERKYQERGERPTRTLPNGYVQVQLSPEERKTRGGHNGFMLEHRYVMEEHLGRPLRREETVHHMNGDRADNRLENLELWCSMHVRGQRVEDLLAFAREIVALYG